MSRIGKHKVEVPAGVVCTLSGNVLTFKKGNIERVYEVPSCISVEKGDDGILFKPLNMDKKTRALWGTSQKNVFNIVFGMERGFKVELDLVGVGYKAAVNGQTLTLQLGYSHDVVYNIPDGVTIVCSKPTSIAVSGFCKKQVGDVASVIRGFRKPEPYKGKGVMRTNEFVYRKEGKKK